MMQTFNKQDNLHKTWMYRILETFADNEILSKVLYFKGGTCASMLGRLDRFSVDLDFDYAGKIDEKNIDVIRNLIIQLLLDLGLKVKDFSKKGLQFFMQYEGEGRNIIKIDANFPLFKSSNYTQENFAEIDKVLTCQTLETMFAHKLCALQDRFKKTGHIAGRDIYDIHYFLLHGYDFDMSVIIERTEISDKKVFLNNLKLFIQKNVTQQFIDEDLNALLSPEKFKNARKFLLKETLNLIEDKIKNYDIIY